MASSALPLGRTDHLDLAKRIQRIGECRDPGRPNSVIVGDQNLHALVLNDFLGESPLRADRARYG